MVNFFGRHLKQSLPQFLKDNDHINAKGFLEDEWVESKMVHSTGVDIKTSDRQKLSNYSYRRGS